MSERKEASAEQGAQQPPPASNGDAFQRAENLLAVETQDGDERARQAFVAVEGRKDGPPNVIDHSVVLKERTTDGPQSDDDEIEADNKVDDALAEEAREDGVAAANDTSQVVWALTPHNL